LEMISAHMITIAIKVFQLRAPPVHLCKFRVQQVLLSAYNALQVKSARRFLLAYKTAQKATTVM
jgi:hypothetical protein